jgi:phosphate transport system protein
LEADREVFPDVDAQSIGTRAHDMVEAAMNAYASDDAAASRTVADQDEELDQLCERASETVVRDLLERELDSGEDIEVLMTDVSRLLLTIRDLERVGDHAVNIAARTVYMVENDASLIY